MASLGAGTLMSTLRGYAGPRFGSKMDSKSNAPILAKNLTTGLVEAALRTGCTSGDVDLFGRPMMAERLSLSVSG